MTRRSPALPPLAALAPGRLLLRRCHEPFEQHRPRVDVDEPALGSRRRCRLRLARLGALRRLSITHILCSWRELGSGPYPPNGDGLVSVGTSVARGGAD